MGRHGESTPWAAIRDAAPLAGGLGIGHTRWATHGEPSEINSHPHLDCSGGIAVVHNGIIENYLELRAALEAKGHVFRSQTDTEALPHLIEEILKAVPAQRMGRPEEVAAAVVFLMSPGAAYITRQVIAVNGGLC